MSPLIILLMVWGGLTLVLVLLLIYRGTLTMHEDDQLFLDEAQSHMRDEQVANLRKIERITPMVRIFGAASTLLILFIAGMWIYQGLTQTQ